MSEGRRAAFFDVDETLITAKSMFLFLRHWLADNGDDGTVYRRQADALRATVGQGLPREVGNRAYYGNFAGARVSDVLAAGQAWYAGYRRRPDAFVTACVAALERHRAAGDEVVLVSGSFEACLAPIAEDLGAGLVLCSDPRTAPDGTYTGEVGTSMIGVAKAEAVTKTIAGLGVAASDCYAYGDHSSDLGMLGVVGHPVVVGEDTVLRDIARKQGWPVLPAAGGRRDDR
ncbi:HAD-IB family hydrolase [Streptomyces sp. OM5714]|uniref:HAD family hydrolase n=1 Tax=Streptomyces sp. OM5714 TaxID=2602736 RepID=UPI0019F68CEB|nr:HAD-IB family hydrolase [Streptomyces sp. OM5714]KAF2776490.1 HAD-superfamily subfamily IB, PSPase [Streptomyces sp. OM5714]